MTDVEWSAAVKRRYGKHCHWPGCVFVNPSIESAHVVPRWQGETRHDVSNGIPLCFMHHRQFDLYSIEKRVKLAGLMR